LIVAKLVNKFSSFYVIPVFITVFTLHLILGKLNLISTLTCFYLVIFLILPSHLHLNTPGVVSELKVCVIFIVTNHAAYLVHLILMDNNKFW
jgi:hypothetical protein